MLKLAAVVAATVLVATLTGCTAPTPATKRKPSVRSVAATPGPTWSSPPLRDRCNPDQGFHVGGDGVSNMGVLQPQDFANMRDLGPRPGATSTAQLHPDGRPASYTVAPHDDLYAVEARFCLTNPELIALNAIRRQPPAPGNGEYIIYRGDILNLDPCTVRTVGDENGRVYNNTLKVYLPTC